MSVHKPRSCVSNRSRSSSTSEALPGLVNKSSVAIAEGVIREGMRYIR